MYKVVWFARFREGMTNQEGRRYWADTHAPIALRTGIERYVQNHVLGPVPTISGVRDQAPPFDGYSLASWNDVDAYAATTATPEWDALAADGPNVFDPEFLASMSAQLREHVVIDGPESPFKVVWVCRFKPGVDREAGHAHWQNVHGPIFRSLEIDRYVQNHVVGALPGGQDPSFEGFSEVWFADRERFVRAIESEAWARAVEDGESFLDFSRLWGAVLHEHVVRAGQRE